MKNGYVKLIRQDVIATVYLHKRNKYSVPENNRLNMYSIVYNKSV